MDSQYTTRRETYKGHAVFAIYAKGSDQQPVVSFGERKARAILASVPGIKAFVESFDQHARDVAADRHDEAVYRGEVEAEARLGIR